MALSFTVCIPTIRAAVLGRAVRSVLDQTWHEWDLVVVGQGDHHELGAALDAVAPSDPRVRYVALDERGLSRARNAATEAGAGEVVAFLDDDCEAAPDWLAALAAGFGRHPQVGLVGGSLVAPPPLRRPSTCPSLEPAEALYEPAPGRRPPPGWDWIGANVAIRRDVLRAMGRWDIHLGGGARFPAGEDTDYKLRLEAAGVPMLSTPTAVVLHAGGRRYSGQILTSQRNYASGNGAVAAKQTLSGDPRGQRWRHDTRVDCLTSWLRRGRPDCLPVDLRRLWYFGTTYSRCLREFEVDGAGLLRARPNAIAGTGRAATRSRSLAALRVAVGVRRALGGRDGPPAAVGLAGGAGGLVACSARHRLVTVLRAEDAVGKGGMVVRRLERRQARASALVLVSDRATGVNTAMRWAVPLERIGLLNSDTELSSVVLARRLELARYGREGAWHRG